MRFGITKGWPPALTQTWLDARIIFTQHAAELVYTLTGGVPRLVNQLCDFSMLYAYTDNQTIVGKPCVQQVLDDGVFFPAPQTLSGET